MGFGKPSATPFTTGSSGTPFIQTFFKGLNVIAGSSLLGLALSIYNAWATKQKLIEFEADEEAREEEARDRLTAQRHEVLTAFETGATQQLAQTRAISAQALAGFADVEAGVFAGFDRLAGLITTGGEQERLDIEEQAQISRGTARADIAARGLSGASILPSVFQGISRERSGQVGRLEERLRGERLGLEGARTEATERLGFAGVQLETELGLGIANLVGDQSRQRADIFAGLNQSELDFIVNAFDVQAPPFSETLIGPAAQSVS